jgi:ATPase subunit of ABC transporter with duplicated ATPase domains
MQATEYTRQATLESITLQVGPRLGNVVIEAKNLRKCYGDRVLIDNFSFSIPPASIVGEIKRRQSPCFGRGLIH